MLKLLEKLVLLLKELLVLVPKIEEMSYIPLENLKDYIPPVKTNEEKLLEVAIGALDTDPTSKDEVSDEVACSEVLSTLIKKVFPDFPIINSTKDLDLKLFTDKRFKRETEPKKGRIIVSPRTNTQFGHTGLWITSERIASNNSKNGLFQGNYDFQSWIKEFKDKRGLRIYIYSVV